MGSPRSLPRGCRVGRGEVVSDAQLAALLTAAGVVFTGFGKLVWSMFTAWLKEREADRVERKADRDADRVERREDRAAMVAVVKEVSTGMTSLGERVSSLERVLDRNTERITGVHAAVEPVEHEEAPPPRERIQTKPRGNPVPIPRPITERPYDPNRPR